jgi:hypothetical protein
VPGTNFLTFDLIRVRRFSSKNPDSHLRERNYRLVRQNVRMSEILRSSLGYPN